MLNKHSNRIEQFYKLSIFYQINIILQRIYVQNFIYNIVINHNTCFLNLEYV